MGIMMDRLILKKVVVVRIDKVLTLIKPRKWGIFYVQDKNYSLIKKLDKKKLSGTIRSTIIKTKN
jgi:hypothetical protein